MSKLNYVTFNEALQILGSQGRLAELLGVRQQTVSNWKRTQSIPGEWLPVICEELAKHYDIHLLPHTIRPDLYRDYVHKSELVNRG